MPRRYWRGISAIIGLAAFGLVYLAYDHLQRSQIDPYPDARYQPARNATFPPASNEHEANSRAYDPHCQEPANKDDSDLCAQWSAVEAVNESNRLMRIATGVTALEFLALIVSLIFTGWAAIAASRAARSAEKAVKLGEAEIGAHLLCKEIKFLWSKDNAGLPIATIEVCWHNAGKTEARQLRFFKAKEVIKAGFVDPIAEFEMPHPLPPSPFGILQANEQRWITVGTIDAAEVIEWTSGRTEIGVFSAAVYVDVFNHQWTVETCSSAVHVQSDSRGIGRFKVYPHHNRHEMTKRE